ncbi:MAG: hypothetical protein QXE16_04745 [Candidatus Bathyarchaeia archaeon]
MTFKNVKVLLLSALFFSALFGVAAISIVFPVNLYGDPIEGGHPRISPSGSIYLCGDPIPGGHPYSNRSV